jgi:actin-related protein 8
MNYAVRWPIYGGHFNTRDYPSFQMVVSDIEAILRHTLKESLEVEPASYKVVVIVFLVRSSDVFIFQRTILPY